MAKLSELLFDFEINEVATYFNSETGVSELTVLQCNNIALILIKTEYDGEMPECVLSAETINILTKRAVARGIPIFF